MDSKTVSTALPQPIYFCCNSCLLNVPIFDDIQTPTTTKFVGGTNKLYYTNCSHVVCQTCRTSINNCCPFCKSKAQMMQISRRMPRYMQMYFEPLRKSIQNVVKVAKFQKEQQHTIAFRLISKSKSIQSKVTREKTEKDKSNDSKKRILDDYKKGKQIYMNLVLERKRRNQRQHNHPQQQNHDRSGQGQYQKNVYTPGRSQQRRHSSTHRRNSKPNLQYSMSPLVYHEMAPSTRDSGFDYATP